MSEGFRAWFVGRLFGSDRANVAPDRMRRGPEEGTTRRLRHAREKPAEDRIVGHHRGARHRPCFDPGKPASATTCNTVGCWAGTVRYLNVTSTGKIWFVVDDASSLLSLVPPNGCTIAEHFFAGANQPALYISADDPRREEKYTQLLAALTTGTLVGFGPIKDTATGECRLNSIYLYQL